MATENILGQVKLLRPKQWVKNTFVLVPLIFSGLFLDVSMIGRAVIAFLLFCVASSAAYIINDYADIEKDRRHPVKSIKRPLASGRVSKPQALRLLAALLTILLLATLVEVSAMAVIWAYFALTVTYTFWLKNLPVIDIFTISVGFVLRVYAGATALGVSVSSWMFVTTLCLALYLASIKRRQEVLYAGKSGREVLQTYSVALLDRYAEMSATGALVFYSMFVLAEQPALVITIPMVLFGLFRYWFLVESANEGESPTDALFSDLQLMGIIVIWGGVCVWLLSRT